MNMCVCVSLHFRIFGARRPFNVWVYFYLECRRRFIFCFFLIIFLLLFFMCTNHYSRSIEFTGSLGTTSKCYYSSWSGWLCPLYLAFCGYNHDFLKIENQLNPFIKTCRFFSFVFFLSEKRRCFFRKLNCRQLYTHKSLFLVQPKRRVSVSVNYSILAIHEYKYISILGKIIGIGLIQFNEWPTQKKDNQVPIKTWMYIIITFGSRDLVHASFKMYQENDETFDIKGNLQCPSMWDPTSKRKHDKHETFQQQKKFRQ